MAYEIPGFSFPLPSGSDFSAGSQFRFVDVNSSGAVVNPSAGGRVVGVRQNRPISGAATTVVQSGVSIVEAGAAVACGANLKTDATGRAVTATTGTQIVGVALEAASAAGVQIAVLLQPVGTSA